MRDRMGPAFVTPYSLPSSVDAMANEPLEYLRILVESHYVERVLKSLEAIEMESLTVRNVQEARLGFGSHGHARREMTTQTQLEIFAATRHRQSILEGLDKIGNSVELEWTPLEGALTGERLTQVRE